MTFQKKTYETPLGSIRYWRNGGCRPYTLLFLATLPCNQAKKQV